MVWGNGARLPARRNARPWIDANVGTMMRARPCWQEETARGPTSTIRLRARPGPSSYASFRFARLTWLQAECEDGWAGRRQGRVPPF